MSGRGVGAGSGRSGKSFEQLEREVMELRRLVNGLVQPKSKARVIISQPRACLALLAGGFSSSAATFDVDNVTPLFGPSPVADATETITVTNRYAWESGDDNAKIEIVYDPATSTWIPRQMECPA